jgi:pimeloyl-ACP methyl ester carboxylesterase
LCQSKRTPRTAAATSQKLLPGFQERRIRTSGAGINVLIKGKGRPLLLIHGHPETHLTWHKIAPALAEEYTVVLPDLRGYDDSTRPGYKSASSLQDTIMAAGSLIVSVSTILMS